MRRKKAEVTEDQNLFMGRLNKTIRYNEDAKEPVKPLVSLLKECRAAIWEQQNAIDHLRRMLKDTLKEKEEIVSVFDIITKHAYSLKTEDQNERFGVSATKWNSNKVECGKSESPMP